MALYGMDIDYRGICRLWPVGDGNLTETYARQDLSWQVDWAKFLSNSQGVDAERIRIYGGKVMVDFLPWSGGLFKSWGFQIGAALRSVMIGALQSWLYLPYSQHSRDGSIPTVIVSIYVCWEIEDLLMAHAWWCNVHFQDVVFRLLSDWSNLEKHWEMAILPVEIMDL